MTTPNPVPARLFVLLARTAPIGVILRRGPSKWVQLIRWDTKNDVFTPGQWFHGRIYERQCDLSPNGKLLIYLAYKPDNKNLDYGKRWTAISKPPYFTALALWVESQSRGGGGRFRDDSNVWLGGDTIAHPNHLPEGIEVISQDYSYYDFSLRHSQYNRTEWKLAELGQGTVEIGGRNETMYFFKRVRESGWISKLDPPTTHTKHLDSYLLLHKHLGFRWHNGDVYEYSFINTTQNHEIKLEGVIWADFDQQGRLILAKDGKLFTATITTQGELQLIELADFNANQFENIPTPDWAKKW